MDPEGTGNIPRPKVVASINTIVMGGL